MDFRIKRKKNCLITQNSISSFNGFSEAQTRSSHWRKAYHFRTHRYYNLGPELLVVRLTVERAVKRQQWMATHSSKNHELKEKPIKDKHSTKVTWCQSPSVSALGSWDTYVCIQGQTHGFWTLKPVAFFTCYVEKKEHHVLFLSLSLSLSPPSWIRPIL